MITNWWLQNQPIKILRNLAQAVWDKLALEVIKIGDWVHFDTMPETLRDAYWELLPLKPNLPKESRNSFLKQYEQYLETYGTASSLNLIQEIFALADFEYVEMRHQDVAERYPWFGIRLWIAPVDDATYAEITRYLKFVLPARCTKHFHLARRTPPVNFGSTPFGRSFGK